ncbi:O-antigen ligase family protein [Deinococcus aquatilis]|jgi:O-antigen ligase|uniref:O-antigen ligase family protein n=1 Tax=Deinococcus aquatilis TaxID=519440 RepID=UPI00039C332D|nr:O-antigen ligase family protein [Deinococcus aquatilis]
MTVEPFLPVPAKGEEGLLQSRNRPFALLVFAICGLPLWINPALTLSFDSVYLTPKILWIYAILLPCSLLLTWQLRKHLHQFGVVFPVVGTWLFLMCLSALINQNLWSNWWGAADRADGVLMHGVYAALLLTGIGYARLADLHTQQRILSTGLLVGSSLLALTNIFQQVHLMGIPGEGAFTGVSATLFGGTLGNRGYMGGALALLLPLAFSATFKGGFPQRGMFIAVMLITWALAGTFARGAWLAGALGLIWLAYWKRPKLREWLPIGLGLMIFTVVTLIFGNGRGTEGQAITDSSGRSVLWRSALIGIQQKPLLGWGSPALWQVMNSRDAQTLLHENGTQNITAIQKRNDDPRSAPSFYVTHTDGSRERVDFTINKVHNEYLDYALTYGIPAALLFIVLISRSIWASRLIAPGLSGAVVAYAAYLLTWPEVIRFAPIAWFIMGLALGASFRSKVRSCPPQPSKNGMSNPKPSASARPQS